MFNGELLYVGGDLFPTKYIKANTYQIEPNKRLDLDSYQDETGLLHRFALQKTATVISFNLIPLEREEWEKIITFLNSKFIISKERKVELEYYDFETLSYKKGYFYIPDYKITLYSINKSKLEYSTGDMALEFIEY